MNNGYLTTSQPSSNDTGKVSDVFYLSFLSPNLLVQFKIKILNFISSLIKKKKKKKIIITNAGKGASNDFELE